MIGAAGGGAAPGAEAGGTGAASAMLAPKARPAAVERTMLRRMTIRIPSRTQLSLSRD
jgi:hypothetical protein